MVTFTIEKNIAVLGNGTKGWQKELNLISWNGGQAKYDIRDWAPDHEKMGKGITLTQDEMDLLLSALGGTPAAQPDPVAEPAAPEAKPAAQPSAEPDPQGFTPEQLAIIEAAKALMNGGK